jgi:hypothetical protein
MDIERYPARLLDPPLELSMKTLTSSLYMLALVAVFVVPAYAQMATPPVGGNQPGSMHGEGQAVRGQHPEIYHAMNKLKSARGDLQHAAHDYKGHRLKAIQDIDAAISELQQALAPYKP